MASLCTRPKSPYYYACFTGTNGRPLKKSTKQVDRSKAWDTLLQWERAIASARAGSFTEAQARRVVSQIVEHTSSEPVIFYSTRAWLTEWLTGKRQSRHQATSEKYDSVIRPFLTFLGKKADLSLSQLRQEDVRGWRDGLLAQGRSGRTCNLAVSVINTALIAAKKNHIIDVNPAQNIEEVPEAAKQRAVFTPEQVAAMIRDATPDWQGMILLGYFAGCRIGDAARMKRSNVDLDRNFLVYLPQKTERTGRKIEVPLHPDLAKFLRDLPQLLGEDVYLFPKIVSKMARKPGGETSPISRVFVHKIMFKAGIGVGRPSNDRPANKPRVFNELSFHSLRYSFNSALANAGIAQEVRQVFTGHSTAKMNEHYTRRNDAALRQALEAIPALPMS